MHGQDGNAAVENVHSQIGGIKGDCPAAAFVYLAQRAELPLDFVLVHNSLHFGAKFSVGVACPVLAA